MLRASSSLVELILHSKGHKGPLIWSYIGLSAGDLEALPRKYPLKSERKPHRSLGI